MTVHYKKIAPFGAKNNMRRYAMHTTLVLYHKEMRVDMSIFVVGLTIFCVIIFVLDLALHDDE